MRSPWTQARLPIGGGLNLTDAPGRLGPGQMHRMRNLMIDGAGRVAPRTAAASLFARAGDVVGIFRFPFYSGATPLGALIAVYNAGAVTFYRVSTSGAVTGAGLAGWAGLTERPVVYGAVIGQKLFLCGRSAGSNLDLIYFDAATESLVTPTFDFTGGVAHAAMQARVASVFNNFLWVAGYGAHTDTDRPELLRWSYLGLQADPDGAGDAGGPGSTNLFDLEDQVQIGERGVAIRALVPTTGRMLILTARAAHHLFGYARTSFSQEQIDGLRGIVGRHSAVEANGRAFYWSRLGPCMYAGSGIVDLSYRLTPRLPLIQQAGIVAVHEEENYGVRWYYPSGSGMESLFWSYLREEWVDGSHPFLIFCAGEVSTTSQNVTSGVEEPAEGPAGAPSAMVVEATTPTSVRVSFTLGDAEAETEVSRDGVLIATLDPGVDSYTFGNLTPSASYDVSFVHLRNGQRSSALDAEITAADPIVPPSAPTNAQASWLAPGSMITWTPGESGVLTELWGSVPPAPTALRATAGVGETSLYDGDGTIDMEYMLRHVDPDDPNSASAFTAAFTPTP